MYVFVTDRRCGEGGKHHSLRALTNGVLLICDDDVEIVREFWASGSVGFKNRNLDPTSLLNVTAGSV